LDGRLFKREWARLTRPIGLSHASLDRLHEAVSAQMFKEVLPLATTSRSMRQTKRAPS
jgi:hypothetical protein